MKRIFAIASLFLAITLVATQSAFAARIYNFLPDKVHIRGRSGSLFIHNIDIASGQRSDSLGWSTVNGVHVFIAPYYNLSLCEISFGSHADMQGGNYMTIGHRGNAIVCTMCGSEHNVMATNIERTEHNWKGDSRTGC
jgi:hypothetical protein